MGQNQTCTGGDWKDTIKAIGRYTPTRETPVQGILGRFYSCDNRIRNIRVEILENLDTGKSVA